LLIADYVDAVHAIVDVSEPGLHDQQVWRSTLLANARIEVYSIPGDQDSGTCALSLSSLHISNGNTE